MSRQQAKASIQVANERVIVTEWRFAPGAETGWHRHQFDYVVVPQTDGTLHLETPEGDREKVLTAGQAYCGAAGVEHNVVNASAHEVVFVETEIK